jgi:phosphonate transport system permease protein
MTSRNLPRKGRNGFLITAAFGLVVVFAWQDLDLNLERLGSSGGRLLEFLQRMMPPDPAVLGVVTKAAIETVEIAIVGTAMSIIISIPLGLMAAGTVTPSWVHITVKWLLAAIRGIPLILVAMIMVGAVGLGPLPGILAIAFHSTGMLAKFFAEAFESVDEKPLAALESVGASTIQIHWFGTLPQIAPDLLRDVMFRFELNLRESLVLGLVGAGGIGFYIQTYIRSFQYQKVATLTIVVLALVIALEGITYRLRRALK